jgi:zinc transport system ATP-binding protein
MEHPDYLIRAQGLSKTYGHTAVISTVSLNIPPRNIVTVIGPNGSGKTTLLKLLLGLETPDSGQVERAAGLRIGYVPQKLAIDPILPLTVGWFLSLSSEAGSLPVHEAATQAGVASLLDARMQSLSGGEMQRVLLARALLCRPQLLVLDEPAQGVDVTGQAMLYELIGRLAKQHGIGVLMVSHDLHLVMSATDHVICLNHHICCSGHPHSVRGDPAFAALFGQHVAASLAVYTHHHDHTHDGCHD